MNVELRGTRSNRYGIGAVVRIESALGVQARPLVLARGYLSSSEPMAHFGLGADALIRRLTVSWPSGRVQTFADLPADRRYTITEAAEDPASPSPPPPLSSYAEVSGPLGLALASREETVDENAVQRFLPRRLNRRGPALAAGDIAGTGRDSLVLGGTTLDPRRVLLAAPGGGFAPAPSLPAEASAVDDGPLLLFDAAGAGHADLLVTRGGNALPDGSPDYQPKLYLNDGHGRFTEAPEGSLPPLLIDAGAVAAADFDHSGRLGVFIGGRVVPGQYPTAPRSALLANLGGRFQDVTDTLAPALRNVGLVTSALWSDVDGDGWPDLLIAVEWGQVRYFHNAQGKGFEDWTQRAGFAGAGTGWWTSLAAVDLNGDGRPDFVAGNVGLNTPYRADEKYPALLYYGDFSGSGEQPELLEAGYENGTLYPLRTRRDLAAILPSVLHRFPRNDAFARASLADIVGSARLEAAQRWAATELRSGVFLSQPDGTYRFEPLPRIAQIAPLDGMIAGFFGDGGNPALFALENSYAPVPSVGRFDGGLGQLLDSDGRGHLRAVAPAASGLVVPGDAKAAVIADLDGSGWPTFVVSRNNAATLAFSPAHDSGRRCLGVRLSGPAGNPCGIGSRVTLVLASGRTRSAEVSAGSSPHEPILSRLLLFLRGHRSAAHAADPLAPGRGNAEGRAGQRHAAQRGPVGAEGLLVGPVRAWRRELLESQRGDPVGRLAVPQGGHEPEMGHHRREVGVVRGMRAVRVKVDLPRDAVGRHLGVIGVTVFPLLQPLPHVRGEMPHHGLGGHRAFGMGREVFQLHVLESLVAGKRDPLRRNAGRDLVLAVVDMDLELGELKSRRVPALGEGDLLRIPVDRAQLPGVHQAPQRSLLRAFLVKPGDCDHIRARNRPRGRGDKRNVDRVHAGGAMVGQLQIVVRRGVDRGELGGGALGNHVGRTGRPGWSPWKSHGVLDLRRGYRLEGLLLAVVGRLRLVLRRGVADIDGRGPIHRPGQAREGIGRRRVARIRMNIGQRRRRFRELQRRRDPQVQQPRFRRNLLQLSIALHDPRGTGNRAHRTRLSIQLHGDIRPHE